MKINIIGGGLVKSGGMRIIFEYANRLTNLGHDVYYYYPIKPLIYKKNSLKVQLKQFYWNILEFKNRCLILEKYFKKNFDIINVPLINNMFIRNADISIATQWPTAYELYKLSHKKGKKIYFIQDYENWNSNIELVDNSYKLPLTRITISQFLSQLLKTKFDANSFIIPNGIDYKIFKPFDRSNKPTITISFISHTLEKKRTLDAIKIVSDLKTRYPEINLMSFGLRKFPNLPKFIEFFENPDELKISDIYNQTDIFLFTSGIEGFGLPPAEAMACGCAVVTSNVGAVPDYSTHLYSALHFTPGDIVTAIEHIEYLINDRMEMCRIAENAISEVRNKLNWDKSVIQFEKCLIEL